MEAKNIRCVVCQSEFSKNEIDNIDCCPACGHNGVPCFIADDVEIKINWHELHILCCWAERWALQIENEALGSIATLDCIVQRLQKQYPGKVALTLRGEVEELKKHYPKTKLTDSEGNEIECG